MFRWNSVRMDKYLQSAHLMTKPTIDLHKSPNIFNICTVIDTCNVWLDFSVSTYGACQWKLSIYSSVNRSGHFRSFAIIA